MGRVTCLILSVFLAEVLPAFGGGTYSPECVVVHGIASAVRGFLAEHPNGRIKNFNDLSEFLNTDDADQAYPWLPLVYRYAFLEPGEGKIPEGNGEIIAICRISLKRSEMDAVPIKDAKRDRPGRYAVCKEWGEITFEWFPEDEVESMISPDVLKKLTLPKPKMDPHDRISFNPRGGFKIERYTIEPTTGEPIPNPSVAISPGADLAAKFENTGSRGKTSLQSMFGGIRGVVWGGVIVVAFVILGFAYRRHE